MAALIKAINNTLSQQQSRLTLGLIPGRSFIVAPNSYSAYFQDYVRLSIINMAKTEGIAVIDIAQQLKLKNESGERWYFPNEGHLTVEGHSAVAHIINRHLEL